MGRGFGKSWGFFVFAVVTIGVASWARAVLVPASGPGTGVGRIEHGVYGTVAGGGGAIFDGFFNPNTADGGDMIQPGGFYPALGGQVMDSDTGAIGLVANVPVTWTTPAFLPAGFGGATTTMVGLGGGNAGLAATNYQVYDNGPDGFASTNIFGASVDYVNINAPISGRFGHFLSAQAVSPIGGYIAAGVKSLIEVDFDGGTGAFFTPDAFWEPLPLLVGFDGIGVGNTDFIQADPGLSSFIAAGQNLTFQAVAVSPILNIPLGASVRMHGTVTLVADPMATFDIFDLDPAFQGQMDWGMGTSSNADQVLPEPASLTLLGLASLLGLRRRRA